jgi:ferritin-like metal-binding protein YciE
MTLPQNYQYQLLTQEEQDEIIATFLKAQERDLFVHNLNRQRFEDMLGTLPAGEFRQRIQQLKAETEQRISEVDAIIKSTAKQLPPQARLQAAAQRIAAREEAARGLNKPQV